MTIWAPASSAALRDLGVHGIDADLNTLSGKLFDHRKHTRSFHPPVDAGSPWASGLTADVDDRGALGGQRHAMRDGAVTVEEQSPVGEGVVGDVHNPHHLRAWWAHLSQNEIQRLGPR